MYEYDDRYPALRQVVAEQYRDLPDEQLEAVLESAGFSAEDVEFSLKDFGRGLAAVGSAVLPVAGTVVGTAFGGPVGAALGGALGSAAGSALGSAAAPPRRRGSRPRVPRPPFVRPPRLPVPGLGAPAATQLLSLIQRPEMMRALQALALGGAGAARVPVGPTVVPPAAFANLLGIAAAEAAAEHHALTGGGDPATPEYLVGESGEALVDVTDANERAARLLEVLAESDESAWDESDEAWEWGESDESWAEEPDAFYATYEGLEHDEVLYG